SAVAQGSVDAGTVRVEAMRSVGGRACRAAGARADPRARREQAPSRRRPREARFRLPGASRPPTQVRFMTMARPTRRSSRLTNLDPSARSKYAQITVQLPKFHLRVLNTESVWLGHMRRSQLLELLVLRKAGRIRVERVASARQYRVERGELESKQRYVWHC